MAENSILPKLIETTEQIDFTAKSDRRDLISAINKVFGEDKWRYIVTGYFDGFHVSNGIDGRPCRYRTRYKSFVRIKLENGNFCEDMNWCIADESTEDLAKYNARISSIIGGLKKSLLSFGVKIEREPRFLSLGVKIERRPQQLQRWMRSTPFNMFKRGAPMDFPDLTVDFPDLILVTNKVFGESKWSYTVVDQIPYFDDIIYHHKADKRFRAGCLSIIKVQLENGNFQEDVGYYVAEECTKGLAIHKARIGSAINALKRVILSFGDKIEKELQQLQRQIIPEQINHIQRDMAQSWVNMFAKSMDLAVDLPDLLSAANKVFGESKWSYTVVDQILDFADVRTFPLNFQNPNKYSAGCVSYVKVQLENGSFREDVGYCSTEEPTKGLSILNAKIGSAINALKRVLLSFGDKIEKELQQLQREISLEQTNDVQKDVAQSLSKQISEKSNVSGTLVSTVNSDTTDNETNPSSSVKVQSSKIVESSSNKTNFTSEQKSKPASSTSEMLRMKRKRKLMEE